MRQGQRGAADARNRPRIVTDNEWRTADGDKILDEKRTISFYDLGPDLGRARLLVVDSDLFADVCPITFGDTKEGSFGVRVRTDLTEEKGKGEITNADGKIGREGPTVLGPPLGVVRLLRADRRQGVGMAILADPANPYPSAGTPAATA